PLLLFPIRSGDGDARARAGRPGRRRRPPPDRRRGPVVLRRPRQQLRHALGGGDGRRLPGGSRLARARDRYRLLPDEALGRRLLRPPARAGLRPGRPDGDPVLGLLAALAPDGRRALANCTDPSAMQSMVSEEWAGRAVELTTDGTV